MENLMFYGEWWWYCWWFSGSWCWQRLYNKEWCDQGNIDQGMGGSETTYAALFILWRISKNSPSDLATRWRTRSCHGMVEHNEVCVEIHKLSADENMFKTFSSSSKTSLFAATSSKMSNALCLFSLRGSVCPVDCFPGWQGQAGPPSSLPVCPTHARLDGCIQHKCEPARQANSSEK